MSSFHEIQLVANFLEGRAKTFTHDTAPISYGNLASELGFPKVDQNWLAHPFCGIFDALDMQDVEEKRPLRTALVYSLERNIPGEGFFKTIARLRGSNRPETDFLKQAQLWTQELNRLLDYYQSKQ